MLDDLDEQFRVDINWEQKRNGLVSLTNKKWKNYYNHYFKNETSMTVAVNINKSNKYI